MCGIAGQVAFPAADREAVRRMTAALAHRGPDGEGLHADGPCALGHRRLAIIDLAGGAQPMFNEDRSLAVVFNGEIYNYKELAAELSGKHHLATDSDTEVLLHLYEEHGEALLPRLRGMFAFAIWDSRRRRLFAARDRFGEKPFLYVHAGGALWFASELPALAAGGAPLGDIDRVALGQYLELLYVPAPRTIRSGVRKLPAGHALVADEHGVRTWPWWRPPLPGSVSARLSPPEVRSLLSDAVRLQLRADVPVAALLSGGLDSSAVVALMAEHQAKVKTFSVGFGRDDDELPWARMVAQQHGTEHHVLVVQDDAAAQTVEALAAYGEPFGDSSAVPTVAVFREVARHVKVVLTGDGGDELFAGYDRYRRVARLPHVPGAAAAQRLAARLPASRFRSPLRRAMGAIGSRGLARYLALVEVFPQAERAALLGQPDRGVEPPALPPDTGDVDAAIAFDLAVYLPDDLLVKVDTASMRFGLETRAPMLDPVLAAAVVPQPASAKQSATEGKLLLKRALKASLPWPVLRRRKRGFGSPVEQWLRGPLRPMLHDLVGERAARVRRLLAPGPIDALLAELGAGRGNAHQGWALLALEAWLRRAA